MANPFFTIGHSTRPIEEFTSLLAEAEVKLVVDVRTVPRSRFNPQFNRDALPASLSARGIAYEHLAALGGLRGTQRDVPPETNAFWENASFHNYADYAMSQEFQSGLRPLRELGVNARALHHVRGKLCGGAAIAASSPTISSPPARMSSIFLARATSSKRI